MRIRVGDLRFVEVGQVLRIPIRGRGRKGGEGPPNILSRQGMVLQTLEQALHFLFRQGQALEVKAASNLKDILQGSLELPAVLLVVKRAVELGRGIGPVGIEVVDKEKEALFRIQVFLQDREDRLVDLKSLPEILHLSWKGGGELLIKMVESEVEIEVRAQGVRTHDAEGLIPFFLKDPRKGLQVLGKGEAVARDSRLPRVKP